jgi:predicted enzyme involved in methoxymalonyl-ACP biosynthesis
MSCRVIGRNVEKVFFDYIMRALVERGIDTVRAQYIKTLKNQQVEGFYDSMYFHRVHAYEKACDYLIKTEDYKYNNIHYIEVRDGRQD